MSKKRRREILAKFIGLSVAHKILILFTNKLESIKKMGFEIENYDDLSRQLSEGNWNSQDIDQIKELAEKRCIKKLNQYEDLDNKRYSLISQTIEEVMKDLELE